MFQYVDPAQQDNALIKRRKQALVAHLAQCIGNHLLLPRQIIQIERSYPWFGSDIFYMNGIGFHPYFGYGNAVRGKLHSNDFICAFANRAGEFGKFCKRFNYRQFLIPNRIN